jgi:hypothetical protein
MVYLAPSIPSKDLIGICTREEIAARKEIEKD